MNEKKRLNYISIEPETHGWLVNIANGRGEHIGDCAGQLLDEARIIWKPPEESESARQLYWEWVEFGREERQRKRVYEAALMYQRNPTEEGADRLGRMCERVGLDFTEVLGELESDPFASLIEFSRNGSVLGTCIRWLPSTVQERGNSVPVKIIQALGKREGFSESTINRARRAINNDFGTPTIKTRRVKEGWVWYLEDMPSTS